MRTAKISQQRRSVSRLRRLSAVVAVLVVATGACASEQDATPDSSNAGPAIDYRDRTGPYVSDPDRAMAMTVDAVDIVGDDILVRIRVENRDDNYLDMGVQGTIYGPLLVMSDDRENEYESFAVEPAGIPGRRVADLSFRLIGPLDTDAESFTLELATQRGPLTSPPDPLPEGGGARWLMDDPAGGSEPVHATAPRLPDLVHFWLETDPLSLDR